MVPGHTGPIYSRYTTTTKKIVLCVRRARNNQYTSLEHNTHDIYSHKQNRRYDMININLGGIISKT